MAAQGANFPVVAEALLNRSEPVLQEWLPGGRRVGSEWVCGNLQGEAGQSLSINVNTGAWQDFATGEKGGDLISLYAAIHRLSQIESLMRLSAGGHDTFHVKPRRQEKPEEGFIKPHADDLPKDPYLTLKHPRWKEAEEIYTYQGYDGDVLFYIARYQPPGETKQFAPWTWTGERWRMKAPPAPRPLYGLQLLRGRERKVLIVEGEKAADAARRVLPDMACLSWPGGVAGVSYADWLALKGRDVLMWPDNDDPGKKAMQTIAATLKRVGGCKLRIIDLPVDLPRKWDIADAVKDGWDQGRILEWAKPLIREWIAGEIAPQEEYFAGHEPVELKPARHTPTKQGAVVIENEPTSQVLQWKELNLDTNSGGVPHWNLNNAVRVLEHNMTGKLWLDTFLQRIMTTWDGEQRQWRDYDDHRLLLWMQRDVGLHKLSKGVVQDAVVAYAVKHARNECQEWMHDVKWDGESRLLTFMAEGFGAQQNEYTAAVGKNWIMSMVARVMKPGCQVDNMPILEGPEGIKKSSALRAIGGEWFAEVHEPLNKTDFFQVIQGLMLAEIPEMHAFRNSEVERIKGVISNRNDRYRASYGRHVENHPRQCVFVGTTNRDDYNRSDTGARRLWPIACAAVNVDYIREQRDQFFAEALALYKKGESWWEVPLEMAKAEVEARFDTDAWHSDIEEFIGAQSQVSIEFLFDKLQLSRMEQDSRSKGRIVSVLKRLGFSKSQDKKQGQVVWQKK